MNIIKYKIHCVLQQTYIIKYNNLFGFQIQLFKYTIIKFLLITYIVLT